MKYISFIFLTVISISAFAQGEQGMFLGKGKTKRHNTSLGNHIISFSPVQVISTRAYDGEPDLAVNFSYEYIANPIIGIKIPVSFSIYQQNAVYIAPTIKFYPKKQGVAKYAVGPQFLISVGDDRYYNYISSSQFYRVETRNQFSFLINNSINFTFGKHFYTGADIGIGFNYYDSFKKYDQYNYYTTDIYDFPFGNGSPIIQLNYNLGIRF
ncbi:MAG: hypothetical protein R2831_08370 [Chitinophagaceae bacterium]